MQKKRQKRGRVRLQAREGADVEQFSLRSAIWFFGANLIMILFAIPFASWDAFILMVILHAILGSAITLGAHRYFSHFAFRAPRWLENTLGVLYTISFDRCGEGVISWAAGHKFHHAYPDEKLDPHSPVKRGFWHAYLWHYIYRRKDLYDFETYKHYCPALSRKPFIVWLDKPSTILGLQAAWISLIFMFGGFVGDAPNAYGFDLWNATSFVVWGVFTRYCYSQFSHSMVDTVTHGMGPFKNLPDTCNTGTLAKNNPIFWFASFGNETWHNNHHAFPRVCTNGEKWYQLDFDTLVMKTLGKLKVIDGMTKLTEKQIKLRQLSRESVYY